MKTVLTIAGSDCSGGAGIQADLKTIGALGAYGMSVIVSLTAQNTCGISSIYDVSPEFIHDQLKAIFDDIRPDAIKIGMIPSGEIVTTIADYLKKENATNIVIDPVMIATTGRTLVDDTTAEKIKSELFPLAEIITPNMAEASYLTDIEVVDKDSMEKAAHKLSQIFDGYVLIKGGHLENGADDYIYKDNKGTWLAAQRINNPNTHGTGCTLSSAIATYLALGCDPVAAVKLAKEYITGAIKFGLDLGHGDGPMNHFYNI